MNLKSYFAGTAKSLVVGIGRQLLSTGEDKTGYALLEFKFLWGCVAPHA